MSIERSELSVERSGPAGRAVFLSYASQDAEAARRIAEALRVAGVEVWFDQSELVGGDKWDHSIRRQIRECAVFAPVISANTQARGEGYFRLEWKLAADRSHLMARDQIFFLPVVIDDTPYAEARVPDEFHAVQWTQLLRGETGAVFCARVQALLAGAPATRVPSGTHSGWDSRAPLRGSAPPLPSPVRRTVPVAVWVAAAVVTLATTVALWPGRTGPASPVNANASQSARPPEARLAPAPLSEARQLVAKARVLFQDGDDAQRENFFLAEELLKQAVRLDVADGEVWSAYSQLSTDLYRYGYDRTPVRREALREQTERAIRLAPQSVEAQLAHAAAADYLGIDPAATLPKLRQLAQLAPDHFRVWHALGRQIGRAGMVDEAGAAFARADELARTSPTPMADAAAYFLAAGRYAEAEAAVAKSLARRVNGRALTWDVVLKLCWHGDKEAAGAALEQWPPWFFIEDRGASLAGLVRLWRREPDQALAIYEKIPREYVRDISFTGPRAVLTAIAHTQAGNREAAQADWALALQAADRELAAAPGDSHALHWKAWALAQRGDSGAAEDIHQQLRQRKWTPPSYYAPEAKMAGLALVLGQPDQAIAILQQELAPRPGATGLFKDAFVTFPLTRAVLALNPLFDPLRGDERFRQLLAKAPSPSGRASDPSTPIIAARRPAFAQGFGGQGSAPPTTEKSSVAAEPPSDLAAKSVAVLPFENLSTEPDNARFADGMHDEVLTALAKVAALTVIGRTSVLPHQDPAQRNLKKISAELGVGSVVEGTVRRDGNRVRIAVKLIDVQTGRQLWGGTYEDELTDVFAIQAAIAKEIAATLSARFTAGERALIERRPTENVRAYELYLHGKLLANDLNAAAPRRDFDRAAKVLEEAVSADPGFAQAYALLSRTHAASYLFGTVDPSTARRELARDALAAAQRIAPSAPETRFAEGRFAYVGTRDFAEAMRHYQAALAALPNDSALFAEIGMTYRIMGQTAEGAAAMARAHAINPLDLNNATNILATLLMLRRFEEAARIGERYTGTSTQFAHIALRTACARYEVDGDRAQFVRRIRTVPALGIDTYGLIPPYIAALFGGDVSEAARLLGDPRFGGLPSTGSALVESVALCRAMLACLLGQRELAAAKAAEAEAFFRSRTWTPRQEPVAALELARAAAYAGGKFEALKLADALRREVANTVTYDNVNILNELGRVYAVLGAREEALACLRAITTGPSCSDFGTPRIIRIDPCWSRIADDPRFEEILKAAKPL